MSTLRLVGRPTACAGFALAGLRTVEVRTPGDVASELASLAADGNVGVLLVEQWALDTLDERARRDLLRRPRPIVVPFPNPQWGADTSAADQYVLDLLQRAIGYRVRLR